MEQPWRVTPPPKVAFGRMHRPKRYIDESMPRGMADPMLVEKGFASGMRLGVVDVSALH